MNTTSDITSAAVASITKLGGPSRVAKKLGILPWAVSKWTRNRVPAERIKDVLSAFPGEIEAYELRPDLYSPEQHVQSRE